MVLAKIMVSAEIGEDHDNSKDTKQHRTDYEEPYEPTNDSMDSRAVGWGKERSADDENA